jgi:2-polyprenyl-3-methyl-5-hydroxy-6-metoxy-1,4-benzoquinol methylase
MPEDRVNDGERITTEQAPTCLFCRIPGQPFYNDLSDRLFGAPGIWHLSVCPRCGLVWLSPRPIPEEIYKVYTTYFTHEAPHHGYRWFSPIWEKTKRALIAASVPGYEELADGKLWRTLGATLAWLPPLKERATLATMCLAGTGRGKLLDVGCGNGAFLSRMREAGWEVSGIEPDPAAARQARERQGIQAVFGTMEEARFQDASFDAVTLSNVIEHVYDPFDLLSKCRRLLKTGGALVLLTPNLDSLGHQRFRRSWYSLDPPRHLYLFSPRTLRDCCEKAGLQVKVLRTSARVAHCVGPASEIIRDTGVFRDSALTWRKRLRALAFQAREELALRRSSLKGEELVLIASALPADHADYSTQARSA